MPENLGSISGIASMPLISFYSIIDEDLACLKYAILEIGPNPSFDLDKLKSKRYIDIVGDLYHRKYKNPLYYIASENANKELLDRVYDELIYDKEKEILKHAVTTDMLNLVINFSKVSDITPYILYYSDEQLNALNSVKELSKVNFISIKDAQIQYNKWTQFFFKYIYEYEPFKDLADRTFYFSTAALNLDENNADIIINKEDFNILVRHRSKINLYDIYRTDIIGSYNNDN